MHASDTYKQIRENVQIFDKLIKMFERSISEYPLLNYAIENVVLMADLNTFRIATNVYNECIPLVNVLNEYFGISYNYFGTVLDTCHAVSTIRTYNNILKNYPEVKVPTIDDYFAEYKDTAKLIHLADVVNLGLRKEEHGIVFNDKEVMKQYVDLYKKHNYDCNIVLEIQESDYLISQNLLNNYKMLQSLMEEV